MWDTVQTSTQHLARHARAPVRPRLPPTSRCGDRCDCVPLRASKYAPLVAADL